MISVRDVKAMIPSYFRASLQLNMHELELRDFFAQWLPSTIIDIHTHVNLSRHVGEVPQKILEMSSSTFLYSGYNAHLVLRKLLFPKTRVIQAAFTLPFEGIRISAANQYISEIAHKDSSFLPFCTGTASNCSKFFQDWHKNNYRGIKFYPNRNSSERRILEAFPSEVLDLANCERIPLMMHLPRPLRNSCTEVVEIAERFSAVPIILAHMGVEKVFSKELSLAYLALAKLQNVYLDTSMVISKDVIRCAMETIGPHRLLFATDQPLNLLRLTPVKHPILGLRYMADYPYHWADPKEQKFFICLF